MRELAFAVCCGLSLGLLILPAPWHFKARNTGTLLYIFWAFLGNLVYLVNSVVWSGNIRNPAPVWCDITTKLMMAFNVALPCASLCIQRRLYLITRVSQVTVTAAQKRRDTILELSIGLGFPVLTMFFHYIVQGHRYDIFEDFGCWPTIYSSWPSYVFILPWPTIISFTAMVYSLLTFRAFLRRRATFNEILKSNNSSLNVHRYVRLMALASVEIIFVLPMSILLLVRNVKVAPPKPYYSWRYVHYGFSRITYITRFLLDLNKETVIMMQLSRWCMPFAALLFFAFFGLASETRKQYRQMWYTFLRMFGVEPPQTFTDNKDTPLTPTTARTGRPSFVRSKHGSTSGPLSPTSPTEKKRPDTFAWMGDMDDINTLAYEMPESPKAVYSPTGRYTHVPNTPSSSTSYSGCSASSSSTVDHDRTDRMDQKGSISTARSRTVRSARSVRSSHTGKSSFSFTRGIEDELERGSRNDGYDENAVDDDDATICGVPSSLKRADSMDKPLPEIPFSEFEAFRRSRNLARQRDSAVADDDANDDNTNGAEADGEDESDREARDPYPYPYPTLHHAPSFAPSFAQSIESQLEPMPLPTAMSRSRSQAQLQIQTQAHPLESHAEEHDEDPQVQIFVSSPTNTSFDRDDLDQAQIGHSTPRSNATTLPARSLAPPRRANNATAGSGRLTPPNANGERPISTASSHDGAETVFFTPSPGHLSLFPVEYEVTAAGTRIVYVNEEGNRMSYTDPTPMPAVPSQQQRQ